MPVATAHHIHNTGDVILRYVLVKQVTHRIDENPLRLSPSQRVVELLRHQPQVEALFVRVPGHAAKPLGKRLGVTPRAAWRDLRAPAHGIPGSVGPFDFRVIAHFAEPQADYAV